MNKIYFGQLAKMDISRYMMFKAWMVGDIKSLTKSLGRTLAYMCVCIVSQLCLTLCDLMVCSLTVSSVHQIFQARILEWVIRCSAFFTVQLSHPYMTTGKPIALTRRTFVGKVLSLLFNMLSRLVINFLPRSVF